MNTQNKIIGILAVIALVVGGLAYTKVPSRIVGSEGKQGLQGERGLAGSQGPQGVQGERGPAGPAGVSTTRTLGSVTGPDISSPYLSVAGLRHEYRNFGFTQSTTTPCTFVTPAATTTLLFSSVRVASTTPNALVWTIAKATVPNATTTVFATFPSLAASTQGTAVWTATSTAVIDGTNILGPSTFITWGAKGTDGTAVNSPGGICQAEFLVL